MGGGVGVCVCVGVGVCVGVCVCVCVRNVLLWYVIRNSGNPIDVELDYPWPANIFLSSFFILSETKEKGDCISNL